MVLEEEYINNFLSPYLTAVICGHPFQDRVPIDNDSVMIRGYMDPSLEGAVLFFNCPPQHVLIGPNTTTCMGNGEWEPDPREVECKGIML
ncbi:MAG: CCP domain-containing protein, partial [Proteobacteria bacterium]|nr:CCP domain-containing protein [Pseudomonadota bacterium]